MTYIYKEDKDLRKNIGQIFMNEIEVLEDNHTQNTEFDMYDLGGKWLPPANDAAELEGIDKPILAIPKEKSIQTELLSSEEECSLASSLANAAQEIVMLTLSCGRGSKELLTLIDGAITSPLKKRMFSDEAYYFSLRRELDDLINADGNIEVLPLLLAEAKTHYKRSNNDELTPELIEYICQIDWPGPLMVTLAKRYSNKKAPSSTLELAITEYMSKKGVQTDSSSKPCDHRSAQLYNHVNDYLNAREKLVNHNFRLVVHIAKRYAQKPDYLPDLIQEGMCGLIRAAEKFRPATGNRFSTYAHQWITSKVRSARVNIDKVIPISHDYNHDMGMISQWIEKQRSTQSPILLSKIPNELNIGRERLDSIMRLKQQSVSIDQTNTDHEGLLLHDKIADPNSKFMDKFFDESNERYLNNVIKNALSEREAYIINERFGRLNSDPKTLRQVSDIMGLSCERIRQLEVGALKKLSRWIDKEMF